LNNKLSSLIESLFLYVNNSGLFSIFYFVVKKQRC